MRAIQLREYVKGPAELAVSELPDPVPSHGQYLIRVHAAAANFFDILQVQGRYQNQPPFPWIAGAEFAGEVLSAPPGPASGDPPRFPPGTRVFGAAQGAFATRVCAPESALLPVPDGWSFAEAAGLFVTAPTSYAALVVRARIQPGDWVLVHAAAGGVGLAAVQVAKALGATVIATASSARKLHVARAFGADHLLQYTDQDWPARAKALTPARRGVDIVYDPVGLVNSSIKCTSWNGRILTVGFAGGAIEKVAMNKVLLNNISLVGIHWGQYQVHEKAAVADVWQAIMRLVAAGKLRGTVYTDQDFVGLDSVSHALVALAGRETWGKVVVKIPHEGESRL